MHRMRHYVAVIGLVAGSTALFASPAQADLIRPEAQAGLPRRPGRRHQRPARVQLQRGDRAGVLSMTQYPLGDRRLADLVVRDRRPDRRQEVANR